jgi:hypothetical protein
MWRILFAIMVLSMPASAAQRVQPGDVAIRASGATTRYTFIRADGNYGFSAPTSWTEMSLNNPPSVGLAMCRFTDPAVHGYASILILVSDQPDGATDRDYLAWPQTRHNGWILYTSAPPPPDGQSQMIRAVIALHGMRIRVGSAFEPTPGNAARVTALLDTVMDSFDVQTGLYTPQPGEIIQDKSID